MNNLLEHTTLNTLAQNRKQFSSLEHKFLYFSIWTLAIASLVTGIVLLLCDIFLASFPHAPISAVPLLLIGTTYLGFQLLIRPKPLDLVKALIISSAFLFWGIDQLLPTSWIATTLGDIVIVLYVIDLGWMITDRLKQQWRNKHTVPEKYGNMESSSASTMDKRIQMAALSQKQYIAPQIISLSTGSTAFWKPQRLAPLSCTCASPLAPLHSTICCKEMREASYK